MAYAQDADRDLEEQANSLTSCPICMETFDKPKVLPCQHTFCLACIQSHYNATNNQRVVAISNFPCPTCRAICYVPRQGLAALPTDFKVDQIHELMRAMKAINSRSSSDASSVSPSGESDTQSRPNSFAFSDGAPCAVCRVTGVDKQASDFCVQCSKHFCASCSANHSRNALFADHSVLAVTPAATDAGGWKCETHQADMGYFCEECAEPACMLCVTCGHAGHTVVEQRSAVENLRRRLKESIEALGKKMREFDGKCEVVKRIRQEQGKCFHEAEKNLKKACREAEQKLKDIEKQMLSELKSVYDEKTQAITAADKSFQERQKTIKMISGLLSDLGASSNVKTILSTFAAQEEKARNELIVSCDIPLALYDSSVFTSDVQIKLGTIEKKTVAGEDRKSQTLQQRDLPKSAMKGSPSTLSNRFKDLRASFRLTKPSSAAAAERSTNAGATPGNPADVESDTARSNTLRRQAFVEKLERRLSVRTPSVEILDTPTPTGNSAGNFNFGAATRGAGTSGSALVASGASTISGAPATNSALATDAASAATVTSTSKAVAAVNVASASKAVSAVTTASTPSASVASTTRGASTVSSAPTITTASTVINISTVRGVPSARTAQPPSAAVPPISRSVVLRRNGGRTFVGRLMWKCSGFSRCRDCCFTVSGQIAATEYGRTGRDRVKIFSATGQLLHAIESVLIVEPWSLCFNTATASLLITDHAGTASSIKSVKIASVKDVSSYKSASYLERPSGIAFLKSGELVMTETGKRANKIGIYTMVVAGRMSRVKEFGPRGNGDSEVLTANYVTVDHDDNIVISDCESHHIKVFSSTGQQLLKFSAGGSDGLDMVPQGVAVDEFNNIFVADQTARGVSKFCTDGQQIGDTLRTSTQPWGISFDDELKRLAVAVDTGLEVFQLQ